MMIYMMNKSGIVSCYTIVAAMIIFFSSCGGSGKKGNPANDTTKTHAVDTTIKAAVPGSLDDAKQLVAKFMIKGADYASLTEILKPYRGVK